MIHYLTYEGLEAYDGKIKNFIDEKSAEGLTEEQVLAIINGVDLEANYIEFTIANRSASNEKRAYRHSSGDIAGSNNAKTLCFSEVDGTKYYCAYNGDQGAWTEGTTRLTEGDTVYSDSTASTSVSTITSGKEGFLYHLVTITGTWNPTATDNITKTIISGEVALNDKTDAYSVTFASGGHLTINGGARLRIWQGGITNNDCAIVNYLTIWEDTVNDSYGEFLLHPDVGVNNHPLGTVKMVLNSYTSGNNYSKLRMSTPMQTLSSITAKKPNSDVDAQLAFAYFDLSQNKWFNTYLNISGQTLDYTKISDTFNTYQIQANVPSVGTIMSINGNLLGNSDKSIGIMANYYNGFGWSYSGFGIAKNVIDLLPNNCYLRYQATDTNVPASTYLNICTGLLLKNDGSTFTLNLSYADLVWNPSFEEEVVASVQTRGMKSEEPKELPDDPIFRNPDPIDFESLQPSNTER